jgi:hypothetical protein
VANRPNPGTTENAGRRPAHHSPSQEEATRVSREEPRTPSETEVVGWPDIRHSLQEQQLSTWVTTHRDIMEIRNTETVQRLHKEVEEIL